MSRKRILLPIILFAFAISCLKAKRSPFDVSSKSPTSNLVIGRALTSTNTASSSTSTSTVPATITYGGSGTFKMIPGNPVNYTPTYTGTVESWSITPDLKSLVPELTFDSKTGSITGTPSTPLSLTTFTITAKNGSASKEFTIQLQVLASGENVWTVINGVSGGNTLAGTNAMKYDSTCNCLYVAGTTTGNLDGQTIPSTGGNASGFLSKYDLDGNRIWTRVFGTSGAANTNVTGVVTDSTGNIYLTGGAGIGNFNGINIAVANSWPFTAGYIIKFDTNGNTLWTTSSSPSILHYYSGIMIANNGNVVVAGTAVAASIDGMTNTGWSDQAGIIQQFNPNTGARITGYIIPGNNPPSRGTDAMGVSKDSNGNLYVAVATRTSTSTYCGDGTTTWRPALFRFDSNMNFINCTFIPVSAATFPFGVTSTPSGESYLSGYSNVGATIDSMASIGSSDGYITKFNGGTKVWTRRLGVATKLTAVNSVVHEPTNNYIYLTGMTTGNIQVGETIAGNRDMFVAKYDSSGNQIWLKIQKIQNDTLGFSAGDGTAVAFDSFGTMYSFGDTNGTASGVTNPATPNRSFFLVRNVQ